MTNDNTHPTAAIAPPAEAPKAVADEIVSGRAGPRLKVPQVIIDQIGRYGVLRGDRFTISTQIEWEQLIEEIGAWGYGLTHPTASTSAAQPLTVDEATTIATKHFPRWREDIQERFVVLLCDAFERAFAEKNGIRLQEGSHD